MNSRATECYPILEPHIFILEMSPKVNFSILHSVLETCAFFHTPKTLTGKENLGSLNIAVRYFVSGHWCCPGNGWAQVVVPLQISLAQKRKKQNHTLTQQKHAIGCYTVRYRTQFTFAYVALRGRFWDKVTKWTCVLSSTRHSWYMYKRKPPSGCCRFAGWGPPCSLNRWDLAYPR